LFGARLRVVLGMPAEPFVATLARGGAADVRANGTTLSIGVSDAAAEAPAIVRRLVDAGAAIQTVSPEEPPLEEVYVKLLSEHEP
jgi:hypothetical protein